MSLQDQLTIVVPTYNRADRLRRLLTYYRASGCQAAVHVLDSSSEPVPSGSPLHELLADGSQVLVRRYPSEIPALAKMRDGLERVSTPYVVLWADDDFLVPDALQDGVRLLVQQPEISVVHGRGALFHIEKSRIQWVAPYLQCSVLDETASARLKSYLQRYFVTFYSIHRTEKLVSNFRQVCQSGLDWHTWGELALGSLAVIQGKAMALPRLYMLREGHAGMGSVLAQQQRAADPFDWLTDTSCSSQRGTYEAFRDCLVPELIRQDDLKTAEAREVVKRAFWSYLVPQMTEKWCRHHDRRSVAVWARVRETARRVPGLRDAWRTMRLLNPSSRLEISFEALRHPSSPYHVDFMPIYRAMTMGIPRGEIGEVTRSAPQQLVGASA